MRIVRNQDTRYTTCRCSRGSASRVAGPVSGSAPAIVKFNAAMGRLYRASTGLLPQKRRLSTIGYKSQYLSRVIFRTF